MPSRIAFDLSLAAGQLGDGGYRACFRLMTEALEVAKLPIDPFALAPFHGSPFGMARNLFLLPVDVGRKLDERLLGTLEITFLLSDAHTRGLDLFQIAGDEQLELADPFVIEF